MLEELHRAAKSFTANFPQGDNQKKIIKGQAKQSSANSDNELCGKSSLDSKVWHSSVDSHY